MNAFYKVNLDYLGGLSENYGVAVGNDEGDIMNKVMHYYGNENVTQITFWFGENYNTDIIEIDDFKECPLFDNF